MKTLSLFAVTLIASAALLSSGCSEPQAAPAPATPAAEGSGSADDAAGSSTSSTTEGSAELTSVSFNVEGMT